MFERIVSEEGESSVKLGASRGHSDVGKQGWWFKAAEKEAQAWHGVGQPVVGMAPLLRLGPPNTTEIPLLSTVAPVSSAELPERTPGPYSSSTSLPLYPPTHSIEPRRSPTAELSIAHPHVSLPPRGALSMPRGKGAPFPRDGGQDSNILLGEKRQGLSQSPPHLIFHP